MGGKSKAPPPPDYSGVAAASEKSAEYAAQVSREQLQWAREQYFMDKEVSDSVIDAALERMNREDEVAAADRKRYEEVYQPLEDEMISDSKRMSSREYQDAEAGKAQADVSQQFGLARQAAQDRLESFGIDPSQTRAQALDISTRTQEAAARASAGNQARTQAEAVGRALRSEAINVGRGYPGQVAASYNTAIQSGNQGVNSAIASTQTGAQTMGTGMGWQGVGNQAVGTWGNALSSGYSNAMAQYNANKSSSSGWGTALGLVGGIGTKLLTGGLFAEGGAVPDDIEGAATGRSVEPLTAQARHSGIPVPEAMSPSGGATVDDVPARLTAGEFVVPEDVVRWKGEEFMQRLIESSRKAREGAPAKPQMQAIPAEQPALRTSALPVG